MPIAVLTSGGVDSSVALKLLKDHGHEVTAFYLKIWLEDELSYLNNCPWAEDLKYVQEICEKNKIPLEIINMQKDYYDQVVSYAISELKSGRTPNPDILCNQRIKFGAFYDKIDKRFDKIATGHYAQIEEKENYFYLKRAPDPIKDQTYFLSHLSQEQLKRAMFPIGHLEKKVVRFLAEKFNLPNKNRKDSQGICFLGKLKFNEFVKHHLKSKKGEIIELETNKVLGIHEGFWFFTSGQRKGIKLSGGPYFVVKKNIEKNIVYVSKKYFEEDKIRNEFIVKNINWITQNPPEKSNLKVKIRHGENEYKCKIEKINEMNQYKVRISGQDQGLASGQFAVFYEDEYCLGGGVII
ncbi:tRNA 2-thiouridine(34) synthase MnmA [Candidatus Wolfebacteria bacterium RIFOXYB2_FULL_49_7]|nr:MAG: tRNA-specific 2-thiouridylase MnmA [Candidatus Peregrinibacteria bacterium GW2011_GWA2_33_10]KKP39789.1 MAG: hypothetical protein UR30_C0008G0058 [Candidatus Peregrinibacteria bacterium GW2011_GWC2_33_13]OGM93033.1 MAG: tRNA 2-thiouridine(34) synthase MnmA [Candidatus Wolfebacteria bacterium RIFOXYB2_FULL_49_7]